MTINGKTDETSPADKINGSIDKPDMNQLRKTEVVAGLSMVDETKVFQISLPIEEWIDKGDTGTALLLGHFELVKNFAIQMLANLRQQKAQAKPQLIKPQDQAKKGLVSRIFKVVQ
jgi:hypothetical protein